MAQEYKYKYKFNFTVHVGPSNIYSIQVPAAYVRCSLFAVRCSTISYQKNNGFSIPNLSPYVTYAAGYKSQTLHFFRLVLH